MAQKSEVFDQTYGNYLTQIAGLDLSDVAPRLGATVADGHVVISLFGTDYRISGNGILGPNAERPHFDICVILSRYLIMCPQEPVPDTGEWVTYRSFRDAGPLTAFFSKDVEAPVARRFEKDVETLAKACRNMGGHPASIDVTCDLAVIFEALPMIRLLMTFNDSDDEFPSGCAILFTREADTFLDAECLAMLAGHLARSLIRLGNEK